MTRLERKEQELERLRGYMQAARSMNDLYWISKNRHKIESLEKEIEEMKQSQTATVFQVLSNKDEMVKDKVYKSLLRISLMADACNEACEVALSLLKEHGIVDFSFREKVKELCKLSQDIASVTIRKKNKTMEDFIVDNEIFVDMCMRHADAHIKRKLKI
ncbi:MAG: DUF4349 domain-containing protein [Muribaculaceae bacterium]|nr:DUF4349 domain-containing protein [Muribaculaceae bacterium]